MAWQIDLKLKYVQSLLMMYIFMVLDLENTKIWLTFRKVSTLGCIFEIKSAYHELKIYTITPKGAWHVIKNSITCSKYSSSKQFKDVEHLQNNRWSLPISLSKSKSND